MVLSMSLTPRELWTWDMCKENIQGLRGSHGFPDEKCIKFLGLIVDTENGSIFDVLNEREITTGERSGRFLTNTVFYVLSAYSDSKNRNPIGNLITSKQFRGVGFTERGNEGERFRIIREFGEEPEKLLQAVEPLGGTRIDFPYGDIVIRVNALPQIPITITLTGSDEEFPADAVIFYDESIKKILDSEQTYFLTHLTISRIIELKKHTRTN